MCNSHCCGTCWIPLVTPARQYIHLMCLCNDTSRPSPRSMVVARFSISCCTFGRACRSHEANLRSLPSHLWHRISANFGVENCLLSSIYISQSLSAHTQNHSRMCIQQGAYSKDSRPSWCNAQPLGFRIPDVAKNRMHAEEQPTPGTSCQC